ncbi:MAG: tape measure protein [Thiohalomonadaceae bacterium]
MSNKLDLALILSFVDKATAPARRVQEATRGMTERMRETRDALRSLRQEGKQLDYLAQSAEKLSKLRDQSAQAAQRIDELKAKIEAAAAAGKSTTRFEKSLASAERKAAELAAKQAALRSEMDRVDDALKKQGYTTGNLGNAQQQLAQRIEQTNHKLERQKGLMEAGRKVGDKLRSSWEGLKTAGAWMAGIGAAGGAAGMALGAGALGKAAQFEQYEVMLETLEGSREQAQKSMAWVSDFTAKTPYELDQVTEAYVRLKAYGLDPTHGLLTTLGDTSAAMGKDIMQAVEAIADAITGENERLKEFGIKASTKGGLISYEYTDKQGIQRTLSVQKDDRKAIEAALSRIWNEKYAGGMERLSGTWSGIISNIKDSWTAFQVAVMKSGPFERLKARLQGALDTINAAKDDGRLQQWAEAVGGKIVQVFDAIENVARWLWVNVPKVVDVLNRVASAVGGWENLLWIMLALKAAPLVWATVQLAGMAAALMRIGPIMALVVGKGGAVLAFIRTLGPALLIASRFIMLFGRGLLMALGPMGLLIGAGWLVVEHWDAMKAAARGVVDYVASLPARMFDIGGQIAKGLADGIKNKIGAVKDRVMSLGDGTVSWIKEKLDIHSPSRVFAELGGYISEGLGVGISDKAKLAMQAAGRLGSMLPGALPTALAMGVTAGAAVASPSMAAPAAGAGGTTIINITVTAPAGTDGQQLAKLVAAEVEKIQRGQTARARGRLYDEV